MLSSSNDLTLAFCKSCFNNSVRPLYNHYVGYFKHTADKICNTDEGLGEVVCQNSIICRAIESINSDRSFFILIMQVFIVFPFTPTNALMMILDVYTWIQSCTCITYDRIYTNFRAWHILHICIDKCNAVSINPM